MNNRRRLIDRITNENKKPSFGIAWGWNLEERGMRITLADLPKIENFFNTIKISPTPTKAELRASKAKFMINDRYFRKYYLGLCIKLKYRKKIKRRR